MFRDLHRKLTIYNAVILIIFMIIFSAVIFLLMSKLVLARTDHSLLGAAARVERTDQLPLKSIIIRREGSERRQPDDVFRYFEQEYILRDELLKVKAATEPDSPVIERALVYAKEVQRQQKVEFATLTIEGNKVRLLTIPFDDDGEQGIIQVYANIGREAAFLSSLIALLLGLGLFSIAVLVAIGWVLAGKSLVPIKKSWQQQKDFIADASHELRTPLAVMETNLTVLEGNQQEKISDNIQWLNNIQAETKVMSELVNNLLLLTRVDTQQVELEMKTTNVSKLVEETAAKMAPLFSSKGLQLDSDVHPHISLPADELRIRQLLHILLDNARKFTPPGGKVSVYLNAGEEEVCLRVSDTGIGIDQAEKERIFDRFYRVDKARSREQGSTGLGLSIARWIVAEHNGKIKVDSEVGRGTSFTAIFPIS